nr:MULTISPECIES: hypothetical protein [unclassified Bartonella]
MPLPWAPLFLVAQATQPLSLHSCNVMKVSGLRRFGAAALDCAYVTSHQEEPMAIGKTIYKFGI